MRTIRLAALMAAAVATATLAAPALAKAPHYTAAATLPSPKNFLFWTPSQQEVGYRNIEKIFPTRVVKRGNHVMPLPRARHQISVQYAYHGTQWNTARFMRKNRVAGLIVVHHGKIVLERYGLGETAHDRWTSFSVGKSITSTLVGAAIKDGFISGLNAKVTDYIPALKGSAYDGVTIRELLTMSSGVKWNEDYTDPKSDVNRFAQEPVPANGEDPVVAYMARLPREAKPGTKFEYKTGESDLIGVLVTKATHMHLADYLSEKIWKTVGMQRNAVWMLDRGGNEMGGCCLSMTLRDYARFGLFFMHGGVAGGKQILPTDWVKQASTTQIQSDWGKYGYGFQWWIMPGGEAYEAIGIFGQSIYINPKEDLVVVTNSAWPEPDSDPYYARHDAFVAAVIKTLHERK
ncbi:MAG: serine hydrolase [Alphaproteobacteria bacterium]|nr:serine hydrolase [Alphaproteobacteria bacterium]